MGIWESIVKMQGEIFWTKRGIAYTYEIYDDYILINDDKKRKITREKIEKAVFIENPTPKNIMDEGVWGPSYVYGIITDERIKNI